MNVLGGSRYHDILGIERQFANYKSGVKDMTAVIIIIRRFLQDKEYIHFANELINMLEEVKEVLDSESFENLLEEMGLPLTYSKIAIL